MGRLTIALLVLLVASPSLAGSRVLFVGDSRMNTGGATRIPQLVQNARPDITHCVDYANGRTTQAMLNVMHSAISACGKVTDVVVMGGVNDLLFVGGSPIAAAERLRQAAMVAIDRGARAWILVEPPGPVAWGGYAWMNAHAWTREIAEALFRADGVAPVGMLLNGRDEFFRSPWYTSTCSNDHLHPTGITCRQLLADLVIRSLP